MRSEGSCFADGKWLCLCTTLFVRDEVWRHGHVLTREPWHLEDLAGVVLAVRVGERPRAGPRRGLVEGRGPRGGYWYLEASWRPNRRAPLLPVGGLLADPRCGEPLALVDVVYSIEGR